MRKLITKLINDGFTWYRSRSSREQQLVLGMGLAGILTVLVMTEMTISNYISTEQLRVAEFKRQIDTATEAVKRFSELQQKRKLIEASFSQLKWKDAGDGDQGEMSYLEGLNGKFLKVQEGTRPDDRFRIEPLAVVPFGKEYDRGQFRISFPTSKLDQLSSFLSELSHGEKPLLVTRLRVERRASGDALAVQVDVSSIRQKT